MSRTEILRRLLLQQKWRLLLTYGLFALEMTGSLLRPFFLGMAINDLAKGSYQGLVLLSVVHLLYVLAGTVRHMLDTRTYSAIYNALITRFLSRRVRASDVSRLSAHSTLAKEFVDFLEFDLVYVFEAVFNLFGSLLLLFFYDPAVVFVCFSILVPVGVVSCFFGKKLRLLNKFKNDELEQQVTIIASSNSAAVHRHFGNLRRWQIRISDQEAWNFGILEVFVLVVITASLLITNKAGATVALAGNLVGIYNYILRFVSGLDTIPYTVQRLTSLGDITRRLELDVEDFTEEKAETSPIRPNYRLISKGSKQPLS